LQVIYEQAGRQATLHRVPTSSSRCIMHPPFFILGATKLHMHILSFSLHDMNEYTTIQYKNKALRGRCTAYSFFFLVFRAPKCISCKSNVIDVCKLKVPHCMQLHGPPSYSCFLYLRLFGWMDGIIIFSLFFFKVDRIA